MKVTRIDRPELLEIFSDQTDTATFDGHNIRLTFEVLRPDRSASEKAETAKAYPVARIVLTMNAAAELHHRLSALLEPLAAKGLLKSVDPGPKTKQ